VRPAELQTAAAGRTPDDIAARYEAHAQAQAQAARDLLAFTGPLAPRTILEPGCGTGLYTRMLLEAFPGASIWVFDLVAERVAAARAALPFPAVRFEAADAENLAPGAPYDLITANATFQWFRRLPETVERFARMLPDGGTLSFSFFGPGTYKELDAALIEVLGGSARVTASGFAGRDVLAAALAASFPRWAIEERRYERSFPSLAALIRSIKGTETRGNPCGHPVVWNRALFLRLERAYRDRFGAIRATYQVFLCKGER
jgi:malonyl-ACP O-methyltransferase BioC